MLWNRRPFLDAGALRAGVLRLGLPRGGLAALHSSLGSLGWVEGGERAVLDAFLEALGPSGTLLAPTFTHCFAPGPQALPCSQGAFDARRTPSAVGRVSEALRRLPGAVRSFHPVHSAAAVGPLAADLARGHERSSDFGPETPFRRLIAWGGTIVLLGVGQWANSALHAVEDMLGMPYLRAAKAWTASPVTGLPEPFVCRKCPVGDRDFYNRGGSKWDAAIHAAGAVRRARVGRAEAQVMEAGPWAEAAAGLLERQPALLLCDRPQCVFCVWAKGRLSKAGLGGAPGLWRKGAGRGLP